MLIHGSWLPENRAALEDLVARHRHSERSEESRPNWEGMLHSPQHDKFPPFAVFDWDQTVIRHDIGDALTLHQVEQLGFALDHETFWRVLEAVDAPSLRERVARLRALEREHRLTHEDYQVWLEAVWAGYVRSGLLDPQEGYPWQTRLLAGLTVEEVRRLTRQAIEAELSLPLGRRELSVNGGVVRLNQGIRPYREILDLIQVLEANGIQAWIVSATNIWAIQTIAEYFGIRPDRALGMRTRLVDGVITDELDGPAAATWGKVSAIQRYIHPTQRPILVAGDNITDLPMLEYSADTRLVIDRGVTALREVAETRRAAGERWLIQPWFDVQ